MPVKIRLQRYGAKKAPFYFIVSTSSTNRRDGRYIEKLGTYNPLTVPAQIRINRERATYWLQQGAQATPTARTILSFTGVLYWKHLLRGVKLNLFDLPTAEKKFQEWEEKRQQQIAQRAQHFQAQKKDKQDSLNAAIAERAKAKLEEKLQVADDQVKETINADASDTAPMANEATTAPDDEKDDKHAS